jgi:mono/diheme cytochrome c family protein
MPLEPARSFMRRSRGHAAKKGSCAPAREGAVTPRSVGVLVRGCAIGISVVLSVGPVSGQDGPPSKRTPSARAIATWVAAARPPGSSPSAASTEKPRALLDRYCVTCHNDRLKTANLSLQGLDLTKLADQAELWEKVIRKLRAGVMPPPDLPRPPLPDYGSLRDWLENEVDRAAATRSTPGSVVLHRLNRTEYANAIRDLLGLQIDATTLLPPDDSANGFDNIAGSLTISPTLLESYTTAAARVVRMAVGSWKSPVEATYLASSDASQTQRLDGMPFGTRGGIMARHTFPADGEYKFSIQNFGVGSFIPGEQLALIIDGERAHVWPYRGVGLAVGMTADTDGTLEITVPVRAGSRLVGATFIATNYRPSLDIIRQYDRKSLENNTIPQMQNYPAIGFLRIQGPFNAERPGDSTSRRKMFTCRPTPASPASESECAKQILTTLARRAYRRPPTADEIATLRSFFENGRRDGGFDDGIELALRLMLASPQFLVRGEREPATVRAGQAYSIGDFELASRLSFFLWSSLPDDELITLAAKGRLSQVTVLEQQVRRMLSDPRSEALVFNFAQQLLYLRNLPATSPDGVFYPNWDDELRQSLKRESELFFDSIIREDRDIVDLLTADYTFVDERLARHYGIPNIYGSRFRRVTLPAEMDYRRGLLGKGSFLAVTFTQNFRSSPVKRGAWVLENILGTPPPEPPANVPALEETKGDGKPLTLREQMTLHRTQQPCAGCHKIMDPIGFALENFDADASWRAKQGGDGGMPIDAKVKLFDGQEVDGPSELRAALLRYSPQFVRMFVEKMMTYALGRGLEYTDMPTVRAIVRDVDKDGTRFSAIVLGVVRSAQFRMRVKGT